MAILRLNFESLAFVGIHRYNGTLPDATPTISAILVGVNFATDALYLVLMELCDKLSKLHPSVDPCLFVYDLKIDVADSDGDIATKHCLSEILAEPKYVKL